MKDLLQRMALCPPSAGSRYGQQLRILADVVALLLGLAGVALAFFADEDPFLAFLPIALSAVLFGLPHSAADLFVASGLASKTPSFSRLLAISGAYLFGFLVMIVIWWQMPVIGFALFVFTTAAHFGEADTFFDMTYRRVKGLERWPSLRVFHTLWRGAIPALVPFAAQPDKMLDLARACLERFGPIGDEFTFSMAPTIVTPVLIMLGLFHVLGFLVAQAQLSERTAIRLTIESLLLVAFFAYVPPLTAFGLYFAGWHGLRHALRLCTYTNPGQKDSFALGRRLFRFLLLSLPVTILSLAALRVLYEILPNGGDTAMDHVGVFLILVSAITFPHMCVVAWMDRKEFPRKP